MDLLEKFSAVEVRPADCLTEADRQFCQRQQEIYQEAAEGFYQLAALWTDLCDCQKAALSEANGPNSKWKQKYLMSKWWPEITAGTMMRHISVLQKRFISTLVSYLNDTYHLTLDANFVESELFSKESRYTGYEETLDWSTVNLVVLRYEDVIERILSWFDVRTLEEQAPYELVERCHRAAWNRLHIRPTSSRSGI